MSTRRIAVFGASGAIGQEVTAALLERGDAVAALQHNRPVPPGCRVVEGTVSDFDAVRRTISDNDVILQFATTKGDRDTFIDVAVRGTFHILDAIRERGGCEQFVLAGGDCSVGIWYYRHTRPLTERSPLRSSPGYYALSKVLEETLTEQHHIQYGVPSTILRMAGFTGRHRCSSPSSQAAWRDRSGRTCSWEIWRPNFRPGATARGRAS